MKILKNEPLGGRCAYKTGGDAEYFAEPQTDEELAECLNFAEINSLEITVIGAGYNLLVSDTGVKGLVIGTSALNRVITREKNSIYAGAGIDIDNLIKWTCENGLKGLEAMSGIPGSVGGAVKMNAGAFGTEIKDTAVSIDIMDSNGNVTSIKAADAGFGYRKSDNLSGIVLGCTFKLEDGASEELKHEREKILEKRIEKQPLDYPSCGSVFKRPENNFAGTLIEQCGLKGFRIGGAVVSEKHANFVLNINSASAQDILNVMNHVKATVKEKTGIELEMEVRLIGF